MYSFLKSTACLAVIPLMLAGHAASQDVTTVETPIGAIPLSFGLPADKTTVARLYDEMDFQRATQAYIWALPIVGFAEWQASTKETLGAGDTDLVIYETVQDKLGILTANATTPYIGGFPDLSKTGPLVIDYPKGATAGGVGDFWQRPITDMGETGPDKGKGGKYLIVGPGQKAPNVKGFFVIHSPTNNVFFAFRVLDPDPRMAKALIENVKIYPFADRKDPQPTKLIRPEGRAWSQVPPHGFSYWDRLNDIVQREPVMERDRIMMAMLRPLGIEKGRPFQPDGRQKKILTDGAVMGELMAQANSFDTREEGARYRPDSSWDYVIMFDPFQEAANYTQIDQRAKYFYEAVTTTKGMVTKSPGIGQAYLGAHTDAAGNWLDGGKSYMLHVPPDVPAKLFWSVTVYDSLTRVLIDNPQQVADKSSRTDIAKNADGSYDLYFGASAPTGHEKNWIPTIPGKAWFAYFRFYGPLQPYFDRSWKLPDIEGVKG
ncbi:DUF1254 domain-containing protein [Rhizobium rhizogenes]|jgi:hypothetical protein|uniref:DUF1254 domain-containing protein n=1 Tax=Rhizobium rhizogenes TaxID=359 RepID=UPI0015749820|nr:DUF1254 domain-containing protein [Rhizobium rhizogenes]NTI32852.1 DUF1254 domain-containing protein [Rhizobium rhizogenes]